MTKFLRKEDIRVDDIWVSLNRKPFGVKIVDNTSYIRLGDLLVVYFDEHGLTNDDEEPKRLDWFHLQFKYYKPEEIPDWVPKELL